MRRRSRVIAVCLILLVSAIILLVLPWSTLDRTPHAVVSLAFEVTDATTHEPVPAAQVAIHDESGAVTILRTDPAGIATMARRTAVT